jgi:hypothetical protein
MPFQGVSRSVLVGSPVGVSASVSVGVRSGFAHGRADPSLGAAARGVGMGAEAVRTPDLIEPVVGFRSWRIDDDFLLSPSTDEWWPPGTELAARCLRGTHLEQAPAHDCDCGIYAYYEAWTTATWYATRPGDSIPGAVLAWGRIEASYRGMRAQFARLLCLGLPPWADRERKRRIYAEATRLGIQVTPLKNLARVAASAGQPVPAILRGDP